MLGSEGDQNDLLTAESKPKIYTRTRKKVVTTGFIVRIDKSITRTVAAKEDVWYLP